MAVAERSRVSLMDADQSATRQSDGWAIVDFAISPEVIQVHNKDGERLQVWHIGLIGPDPVQDGGSWSQRATQSHDQLLPKGTKVWLESQAGTQDPTKAGANWVYRHVYTEQLPDAPVGAELLRSGMTWVHPLALHSFVDLYADEQASAIVDRAGLWAETQSSEVFLPEGALHGGFPVNPRVVPTLKSLDSTSMGKELLSTVNHFPVEMGVVRLPRGVLGAMLPRFYSVQLSEEIMDAPPESIAGVLIHELTHAKQTINAGLLDLDPGCYENEIEAFEVTAQYWATLYGPNGKKNPVHQLDNQLNMNLREYNNQRIATNVRRAYGHECGAAFLGFSRL